MIAEEFRRSPEDVMLRYDFKVIPVCLYIGAFWLAFSPKRRQLAGVEGEGRVVDETGGQTASQICQRVSGCIYV